VPKKEGTPKKKLIAGTIAAPCKREQCIVMSGHLVIIYDDRWEIAGKNEHKKCRCIKYIKIKKGKAVNITYSVKSSSIGRFLASGANK
jgi:hypothetical protein